jgi:hypothetical protein
MDEKQKELESKLNELKRYQNEQMEIIQVRNLNFYACLCRQAT